MARIPLVERAFGQDRLARWHRWTGFTLVPPDAGAHRADHARLRRRGARQRVRRAVGPGRATTPGMLLATAGTALLVMVVVTSMRAARRRLRYESWHLLHLYAYLGVGLALPHQLWTGADFIASPLSRAYWWTLYAAAAGAVLVYRLGLPVWRNWRHRLTVSHVVPEGPGLTSVYLRGRRPRPAAGAGRAVLPVAVPGRAGLVAARTRTRCPRPPHDRLLRITVKDLGDGSARVAGLRPGTRALDRGAVRAAHRRDVRRRPGAACWPAASASRRCWRCSASCRTGPARPR